LLCQGSCCASVRWVQELQPGRGLEYFCSGYNVTSAEPSINHLKLLTIFTVIHSVHKAPYILLSLYIFNHQIHRLRSEINLRVSLVLFQKLLDCFLSPSNSSICCDSQSVDMIRVGNSLPLYLFCRIKEQALQPAERCIRS
jgi:hypothetical protein